MANLSKQKFDMVSFGKAIKTYRVVDRDISLDAAVKEVKVAKNTLSRMENGSGPYMMDNVLKVCNWIKISLCDFLKTGK